MESLPLEVRVARKFLETPEIAVFELVSAHGGPLPSFSAGAHIDVAVPGGAIRQYSLCNNPEAADRYVIGVLKEIAGRGGSRAMHEAVQEGDHLHIGAPRNLFPLARGASRSLLLAGGIGVTPILSMAETLSANGAEFEMHYCARSRQRAAFVNRIAQASYAGSVRFHFSHAGSAQKLDLPELFTKDDGHTHAYVCGPRGFMDAALGAARRAGWAEERLHYEFFACQASSAPVDASFEVQLASTGQVITVPHDRTLAQALSASGVAVLTSCEQGVCGTCLTHVLAGEVDHRDLFLSADEQAANDRMALCCSRARSGRLVLDL